jgi:outer membrane protein
MFKKSIFFLISTCCSVALFAQDTWTLERCIEYAQKNSISVKQAQISLENTNLSARQLKAGLLPSVGASASFGGNFGYSINPTTNTFSSSAISFNNLSLSTGGPIYQGGRTRKSLAQNKLTKEANQAEVEQAAQTIALNVATSYLRILMADEQVIAAQKRVEQSKKQLDQVNKFINAGARPKNDVFEFAAQLSRNEQSLVQAQNTVDLEYLNLKQLLELDPELAFKIDKPNINIPTVNGVEGLTLRAIYQQAVSRQPQIRAGEMRLKAAEMQADIDRTDLRPTLNWFGGINTRYSSFRLPDRTKAPISSVNVPQEVVINGVKQTIFLVQNIYPEGAAPNFFTALGNNLGQNLGVSLNIPIYDRGFTRIAVERARLNVMSQQLQNQRITQQLKSDIQNALANAKATKKQWEASEKTYEAAKAAFDNADKKYSVGSANSFEQTTARNNMDNAERDVIIAKYDYLFRLKIVDFYQGRKITLN